jgi:hypothetical protein
VHPSDVETLLISGSIDVAAPAERATEELLPSLAIGQQVILAEILCIILQSHYPLGISAAQLCNSTRYSPVSFGANRR